MLCFLVLLQEAKTQSVFSDDRYGYDKKLIILTIGDSNGAAANGWPQQMRKLLPNSTIINKSFSGNTIGFDNLDRPELNTVKNIDRYLNEAFKEIGQQTSLDYIFIGLGTNDTKQIFVERQTEVAENMSLIVNEIRQYMIRSHKTNPAICIISPPPMDELKVNKEKYGGGDKRIQKINHQLKKIVIENHVDFLDTYTSLKKGFSDKTDDGVHLNEKAQFQIAVEIVKYLKSK